MNDNILEKDIERLAKEIEGLKHEIRSMPSREIVKQALHPIIKPLPSTVQKDGDKQNKKFNDLENSILPDYLKESSPEIKMNVEKLIDLAFHKGIESAAREAQKLGPFVLDAFHDALTDKLYDELKKRNII